MLDGAPPFVVLVVTAHVDQVSVDVHQSVVTQPFMVIFRDVTNAGPEGAAAFIDPSSWSSACERYS
jgi:hypothetical protein